MIKRTTAYTFIILAGLLFLAHAVIPHHHHDNNICFVNKHCTNDNLKDEHGTNGKSHSHDEDDNSDHCILKTPIVLPVNQNNTDFNFSNRPNGNTGHDCFYYASLNSATLLKIPVLSPFIFEQSENFTYSSLVSDSVGLRAPPVV
jgi:hypothetical protein